MKQEQNFCIAVRDWKPVLRRSASSLRFSAALGIARTSSALRSLARKIQAHRAVLVDPDTACPVTIASLCSASSLRFSAALGIARTSSALRSLARKFQALSTNLTNTPV